MFTELVSDVKLRFSNHLRSFKDQRLRNVTSLAKLVHRYKDRKKKYKISWRILRRGKSYMGGGGECNLCVMESYLILRRDKDLIFLENGEIKMVK